MDNLAHVIAINLQPGLLEPCLRINRGIYTASTVHSAPFKIEVSLTYTSGGAHVGPIVSTQLVSDTQFMQQLDAYSVRAKGARITMSSVPDLRTPIVLAVRVLINDASGVPVECWSADTSSFSAPPMLSAPTAGH